MRGSVRQMVGNKGGSGIKRQFDILFTNKEGIYVFKESKIPTYLPTYLQPSELN